MKTLEITDVEKKGGVVKGGVALCFNPLFKGSTTSRGRTLLWDVKRDGEVSIPCSKGLLLQWMT